MQKTDSLDQDIDEFYEERLSAFVTEIVRHGVFRMLIPRSDLIREWIDKDVQTGERHFESEDDVNRFLTFIDDMVSPFGYDDDSAEEMYKEDTNEGEEELDDVSRDIITGFTEKTISKIMHTLVKIMLPLFLDDDDNQTRESDVHLSINEKLQRFKPKRQGKDLTDALDDSLFSLLASLKRDLETDVAKEFLKNMFEGDSEALPNYKYLEQLMKKNNYKSIAIKEAHSAVFPLLMESVDDMMLSLSIILQKQLYVKIEDSIRNEKY